MVALQGRIELDAIRAHDNSTTGMIMKWFSKSIHDINVEIGDKALEYNIKVVRVVAACGCLMTAIFVYNVTGGSENDKWNELVFFTLMTAVVPTIFIVKHRGMKNVAFRYLKIFLPDPTFVLTT